MTDQQMTANNGLLSCLRDILKPILELGSIATLCVIGTKDLNQVEVAVWGADGKPIESSFCSNEDILSLLPALGDAYVNGLLGPRLPGGPMLSQEFIYAVSTVDCEDFTSAFHIVETGDSVRLAAKSMIYSVVGLAVSKLAGASTEQALAFSALDDKAVM